MEEEEGIGGGGEPSWTAATAGVTVKMEVGEEEEEEEEEAGGGGEGGGVVVPPQEQCLICGKLEERRGSTKGLFFNGASSTRSSSPDCDQLKAQLWPMFVLRRVLGFPEEECSRLLRLSFGLNPADWFDLCGGCAGGVGRVLELVETVRELEGKMKKLRRGLKDKLEGNLRVEKKDSSSELEGGVLQIRDEIRKYFKDQLVSSKPTVRRRRQTQKKRRRCGADDGGGAAGVADDVSVQNGRRTRAANKDSVVVAKKKKTENDKRSGGGGGGSTEFNNNDDGSDFNNEDDLDRDPMWTDDEPFNNDDPGSDSDSSAADPLQNDDDSEAETKISSNNLKKTTRTTRSARRQRRRGGESGGKARKKSSSSKPASAPVECVHCFATVANLHLLNVHRRAEHPEVYKYKCEFASCDASFTSKTGRHHHKKTKHSDGQKVECPYCQRKYPPISLYVHKVTCKKNPSKAKEQGPFSFSCDQCDYTTTSKIQKIQHMRHHKYAEHIETTEEGTFLCKLCSTPSSALTPTTFPSKPLILAHLRELHRKKLSARQVQCPQCGKTLSSAAILKSHIREIHEGERAYHCDQCGAAYHATQKQAFEDHMAKHASDGKPTALCSICGLQYAGVLVLQDHTKKYHPEVYAQSRQRRARAGAAPLPPPPPEVPCRFCGESFINGWAVKVHWREAHAELLRWICDFPDCSYVGTSNNLLYQHKRMKHRLWPKVKCPYCAGEYLQTSLYAHKKGCRKRLGITAEEELKIKGPPARAKSPPPPPPQVPCEHCGELCDNFRAVQAHKRAAHPELFTFSCDECDFVATAWKYIYQHRRKVHQGILRKDGTPAHAWKCPDCGKELASSSMYYHKAHCPKRLKLSVKEGAGDADVL